MALGTETTELFLLCVLLPLSSDLVLTKVRLRVECNAGRRKRVERAGDSHQPFKGTFMEVSFSSFFGISLLTFYRGSDSTLFLLGMFPLCDIGFCQQNQEEMRIGKACHGLPRAVFILPF